MIVARPVVAKDGRFLGVAFASTDMVYCEEMFRATSLGDGYAVTCCAATAPCWRGSRMPESSARFCPPRFSKASPISNRVLRAPSVRSIIKPESLRRIGSPIIRLTVIVTQTDDARIRRLAQDTR